MNDHSLKFLINEATRKVIPHLSEIKSINSHPLLDEIKLEDGQTVRVYNNQSGPYRISLETDLSQEYYSQPVALTCSDAVKHNVQYINDALPEMKRLME